MNYYNLQIRGIDMSSLIANHTPNYRQVRLNRDHTVADIFSIRRTTRDEDPDYQTTYQDPNEGRFVLTCNKHSDNIRVFDIWTNSPYIKEEADKFKYLFCIHEVFSSSLSTNTHVKS